MAADEQTPRPDLPGEGGDPVCWLHLICDECGALIERPNDPHRPGCARGQAPDDRDARDGS